MPPIALFDLDNTLVDRQAAHRRWAESFAEQMGLGQEAVEWLCEADDDGFARRDDVLSAARTHLGITEPTTLLVAQYRRTFPDFVKPDPDVTEALKRLRRARWRVGVVTNGPPTQHVKLERSGLRPLVDACCVSEEVGARKPDPMIFKTALSLCGAGAQEVGPVVMVGDAPEVDIGGGKALGFCTIWMHRGRQWALDEYAPDATAGSVAEAVDMILLDRAFG